MKSKAALEQFLAIIKEADSTFLNPEKGLDEQGKIDGYSHLFHLLRTTIDFYLFNDPMEPVFMLLSTEQHKILGDNVDAVYYFTQLKSDQEYEITGKRFDSCYLSFCTYGGLSDGSIVDRVAHNINHRQIAFEADGSFKIKLTPNPQGKNEFKLHEDVVNMFTREYFYDRANGTESELQIKNITSSNKRTPFTDEALAARIQVMSTFFEQMTWMTPLPIEFPLNDFLPPFEFEADQGGWGTIDNIYCFGRYHLKENQYLKIHFSSPKCCYWGIQTWNYLMQSTDYKNHKVSINNGEAKANPDGTYTIYLSHTPIGKDNWISTAGYQEAIMFCRWLLAEESPEQPTVELCTIEVS